MGPSLAFTSLQTSAQDYSSKFHTRVIIYVKLQINRLGGSGKWNAEYGKADRGVTDNGDKLVVRVECFIGEVRTATLSTVLYQTGSQCRASSRA